MKKTTQTILLFVFLGLLPYTVRAADPLVVHEWGTITTKQSAGGAQYGGLNKINAGEELPSFVYRLDTEIPALANFAKGPPPVIQGGGHPEVTMRLETPVLYFYPKDEDKSLTFDVDVSFNSGLLNEYYPYAKAEAGDIVKKGLSKGTSHLSWKKVTFDTATSSFPQTQDPVWLAPRKTKSTPVCVSSKEGKKECEQYLFYRGVASIDSPFFVNMGGDQLNIHPGTFFYESTRKDLTLWVVDVQKPGALAFVEKKFPSNEQTVNHTFSFTEKDYSETSYQNLRTSMRQALIKEGLFENEAEAMLNTWDHSYFKQPGKRIFYIAPKAWVDKYLPLKISVPHNLTRVIVGRIDLEK